MENECLNKVVVDLMIENDLKWQNDFLQSVGIKKGGERLVLLQMLKNIQFDD